MQTNSLNILAGKAASSSKPALSPHRAEAITNGLLIDVTVIAVEAGFMIPVALTRAAWDEMVAWTEQDSRRQIAQDMASRLWNVLWVLRCHSQVKRDKPIYELPFEVHSLPRDMKSRRPQATWLKAVIQPGDAGEAVITIMLPRED